MKAVWSTGNAVRQVVFSPDGLRLASVRAVDVLVSDLDDLRRNRIVVPRQETEVSLVAWSRDSTSLALVQADSSLVIVSTFAQRDAGDQEDDERWIDLRGAGNAAICAWNDKGWLATVASNCKVLLSHPSMSSRWSPGPLPGIPTRAVSSSTVWVFAIPKEGVCLCSADECAIVKRITESSFGPPRSLSIQANHTGQEMILVCERVSVSVSTPRSRRMSTLSLVSPAILATWGKPENSFLVARRENERLILAEVRVTAGQNGVVDMYIQDEVLVSDSLPRDSTESFSVFEISSQSQTLCWGFRIPEGFELHATSFTWTADTKLKISDDRVLVLNGRSVTDCSVSSDGRHVAVTVGDVGHLIRLLSRSEQMLDIFSQRFSFVEFAFYYVIPAMVLCFMGLGLFLGIYPWRVAELVMEVFWFSHFKI